jgi:putative flippase GtrA
MSVLRPQSSSSHSPATQYTPAHNRSLLVEVRKFVIVGLINTALDLVVLNSLILLTQVGRNGLWFTLFKAISFLIVVTNSYCINHSWTFERRTGTKSLTQASRFLLVSVFGAFLNVSGASYVATFVPPIHGMESYWPSIAALAGAACGLASNFIGYKHIVFSVRQSAPAEGS